MFKHPKRPLAYFSAGERVCIYMHILLCFMSMSCVDTFWFFILIIFLQDEDY